MLSARLDKAGFPEIEVGHGLGLLGALRAGSAAAATDAEYIDAARGAVKHARLGVFAIPGIATPASVVDAARRGIDILKIGLVAGKVDHGEAMVKLCRDNGVVPYVFFMQSSLVPADVLADNAATGASADIGDRGPFRSVTRGRRGGRSCCRRPRGRRGGRACCRRPRGRRSPG